MNSNLPGKAISGSVLGIQRRDALLSSLFRKIVFKSGIFRPSIKVFGLSPNSLVEVLSPHVAGH